MVKRKANQSLDEWLIAGELAAAARRSENHIGTQSNTPLNPSTTELVEPSEVAEPSVVVPVGAEVTLDEATRWFWSLLGQAGFELW